MNAAEARLQIESANIRRTLRDRARLPVPGHAPAARPAPRLQWLPGFGIGGEAAQFD